MIERFSRFAVGAVLNGLYDFEVEGREHLPGDGPFLLVANHGSYIDPFVLGYPIRTAPRFVTTIRVFRNPLTRWYCDRMGAIPARRGGADTRVVREVYRALKQGSIVGLFPEGERSWDGSPLPLMSGVLKLLSRCEVPIVPVSLIGTYEAWPRWAPQPRLAPLRLAFGRPFRGSKMDRETLRQHVEASIHRPVEEAGPVEVRGVGLARGLERLLWWCPACEAVGGLEQAREDRLGCAVCGATYVLDERYFLAGPDPSAPDRTVVRHRLRRWYRSGPPPLRPVEATAGEREWLDAGENVYLRSEATLLIGRHPRVEKLGIGEIVLTDDRLHYRRSGISLTLWSSEIRTIVIEGPEVLQVGTSREMWRLWLPNDSALKWQTYLEALNETARSGRSEGQRSRPFPL